LHSRCNPPSPFRRPSGRGPVEIGPFGVPGVLQDLMQGERPCRENVLAQISGRARATAESTRLIAAGGTVCVGWGRGRCRRCGRRRGRSRCRCRKFCLVGNYRRCGLLLGSHPTALAAAGEHRQGSKRSQLNFQFHLICLVEHPPLCRVGVMKSSGAAVWPDRTERPRTIQ